ncbi:MAG: bifunctional oligoribonuclease/PAP phosphatase NrnA [Spirochaetales bacterium]|nr:bifunctional oligoribonuclease/PAP phosphatase NrnA [Spirochaetales bacterium]
MNPSDNKFEYISKFLFNNDNFIITAHETPDGDALGSESAMYVALKALGKNVMVINADLMADKYTFLDYDNNFQVLQESTSLPKNIEKYFLIILDTSDIDNIGQVKENILSKTKNYIIIDHHESFHETSENIFIMSDASSTCEILYQLFEYMNIEVGFEISQALFVGIVYDTGSFIYPKTTAKTFSIAHKLVEKGVLPNDIYGRIYESNSISALKLQSRVSSTLKLYYDQQVAVQIMLKETISECEALYEEADSIINTPLKSKKIRVSVFFKENSEGILRCSMRSKGNVDVAKIAQTFNGGGHKTAAGFKSKYPLDEILVKVLKMLEEYFI